MSKLEPPAVWPNIDVAGHREPGPIEDVRNPLEKLLYKIDDVDAAFGEELAEKDAVFFFDFVAIGIHIELELEEAGEEPTATPFFLCTASSPGRSMNLRLLVSESAEKVLEFFESIFSWGNWISPTKMDSTLIGVFSKIRVELSTKKTQNFFPVRMRCRCVWSPFFVVGSSSPSPTPTRAPARNY